MLIPYAIPEQAVQPLDFLLDGTGPLVSALVLNDAREIPDRLFRDDRGLRGAGLRNLRQVASGEEDQDARHGAPLKRCFVRQAIVLEASDLVTDFCIQFWR